MQRFKDYLSASFNREKEEKIVNIGAMLTKKNKKNVDKQKIL